MFTSDIILAGTVIIEATAFRWSVTDGFFQRLTVSHRILGCVARPLTASPASQARAIGREMLMRSTISVLEAVDDAPYFRSGRTGYRASLVASRND